MKKDSHLNPDTVSIDGYHLTPEQLEAVARRGIKASLAPHAHQKVQASADVMIHLAQADQSIYGVNTGFGIFAHRRIDPHLATQLSRNLILSHAVGLGDPFSAEIVRAAMLIRANSLAQGHSGVRPVIILTLLDMLARDVTPFVPSQGSLGSSGDLAPLAHLALIFSSPTEGEQEDSSGQAWLNGELMSGTEAMAAAQIPQILLGPKEGLAVTNGATFATALLSLACIDAERVLRSAEIASALSIEALLGKSSAFDQRLHEARSHPGQIAVASRFRALTNGSEFIDADQRVQDAYSIRCTPQILGPAWEILEFAKEVVRREMNAATDNPLLFGEAAISGGNFHGEPLGMAADYLKIALTKVCMLSERRTFRLLDEHTNAGLQPMLCIDCNHTGIHSGMMMPQYTAASLTIENQSLATPDSIHSLPTSAGQEDINANATTAARHLTQVLMNLSRVIAIEILTASQALDLRMELLPNAKMGIGTTAAHRKIREHIPFRSVDHPLANDIEDLTHLTISGELIESVDEVIM